MKIPNKIKQMMQCLIDDGFECYIIGGAVRDFLMGVEPHDYDLFTDATGEQILRVFPKGKVLGGEERQEKILTVVVDDVEISQYRNSGDRTVTGTSFEKHICTCDLTINSMACNINGEIIDIMGGQVDIIDDTIRAVGIPKERIAEDKLRVMRAIRFALKYNFEIDMSLIKVIKATDITTLPPERIRDELLKILPYSEAFEKLIECNLYLQIFPEVKGFDKIDGGKFHKETVEEHMIGAHNYATTLTTDPLLLLANYLHDIGKGFEVDQDEDGNNTFKCHDVKGEEVSRSIMSRLKFSKLDIRYVATMVRNHMFYKSDNQMKVKRIRKLINQLKRASIPFTDFMILQWADGQANKLRPECKFGEYIRNNDVYEMFYQEDLRLNAFTISDLAIGGQDLLKLGLKPGPQYGIIIKDVFEQVECKMLDNMHPILNNYVIKGINDGRWIRDL